MGDSKIYRSKIEVGLAAFVGVIFLTVFVIMIANNSSRLKNKTIHLPS